MNPTIPDPEKGISTSTPTSAPAFASLTPATPQINSATSPPSISASPPHQGRPLFSSITRLIPPDLLEARGIDRVTAAETHPLTWRSYLQAFVLWVSINLAAVNITLGMLASQVFGLGFVDASLCAVFGSMLGSAAVAYSACWGPKSGLRTMIFARFTMGWWPGKLVVLLNLIVLLGYSMIDCVVAGQILSAVSPDGNMSVVVGIIIVAVITWLVTTFGIRVFHYYERFAFVPQLIVVILLYVYSAPNFDITTPSTGTPLTQIGNRISFFSLCLSAAITYAGAAADYFVYYPPSTPAPALFLLSLAGLTTSFTLALVVGIGLSSGIAANATYADAYAVSQGALIVTAYDALGGFGRFCAVVIALGLIANLIPPTYSSGVDFQLLGGWAARIPRWAWNTFGVVVYTVCALAGRDYLAAIFRTNFLALMGYWVAIWIAMTIEEQVLFREGPFGGRKGWDWNAWDRQDLLPIGIAALVAFLIGWVGAILCMAQVWYVGPLARPVGDYGADMGNYVGFGFAALIYPPLRWLELRRFRR